MRSSSRIGPQETKYVDQLRIKQIFRPRKIVNVYRDVIDFHLRFDCEIGDHPQLLHERRKELMEFRIKLVGDEVAEFFEAIRTGHPVDIACEAADVIYTVLGTLISMGIPFEGAWRAVHGANMRKQRVPGQRKVGKPKGWVGPRDEAWKAMERDTMPGCITLAGDPVPPPPAAQDRRSWLCVTVGVLIGLATAVGATALRAALG